MSIKLKRGFTLIEIVIVLAIAALIMVVVFLAVTGAQRGQRDQSRKDLMNRTRSSLEAYRGNSGGTYPTVTADQTNFVQQYLNAGATATSTSATISNIVYTISWTSTDTTNANCTTSGTKQVASGTGNFNINTSLNPAKVTGCLEAGSVYSVQ